MTSSSKYTADAWIVAGAPGSGKTTTSNLLVDFLKPHPALLDKDTMYGSFVSSILADSDRPAGEREGAWYNQNVKIHEYSGLTATAQEIRSNGCPVILSAPFTDQIRTSEAWSGFVQQLGGGNVHLIWLQTDKETLHKHLLQRSSSRDTQKLANFDEFTSRMQLDTPPPVAHIAIDNRESSLRSLISQVEDYTRTYA